MSFFSLYFCFFFNDTATTEIYTLSLHDALPICALDMPFADVERISKLIPPPVRGRNVSISQAIEQVPELRKAMETNDQVRDVIDLARRLEGCARHVSVHAAGVVIT